MKKNIINFIDQHNIISAIIFLAIGIGLIIYLLLKKESFLNFKGSNILKWNADINTLAVIVMSIIFAIIYFFK